MVGRDIKEWKTLGEICMEYIYYTYRVSEYNTTMSTWCHIFNSKCDNTRYILSTKHVGNYACNFFHRDLRTFMHIVVGSLLWCWLQVAGDQVTYWRSVYLLVLDWLPICRGFFCPSCMMIAK